MHSIQVAVVNGSDLDARIYLFVQESDEDMKMKMKTVLLGSFTVAACAVGSMVLSAPANALYFNQDSFQFDFSSRSSRVAVDTSSGLGLDFFNTGGVVGADNFTKNARIELTDVTPRNSTVTASQFAAFVGSVGTVEDVKFTDTGLLNFININLKDDGGFGLDSGVNLVFNLTEAISLSSTNPVEAKLRGILKLVGGSSTDRVASALLTTQIESSGATSFSITAVPTPAAVLPALIGMGTAAFRKKKREGEDELALASAEEA